MSETATAAIFQSIPLDNIRPAAHQARKNFDEESIKALAESMKQEGLLQPITVRFSEACRGGPQSALSMDSNADQSGSDGQGAPRCAPTQPMYELVSGERRLRAAKLLGWPTIDARVIETVSEAEAAAKGLVENLQREDLNPIEEAEGLSGLNKLDPGYWTQTKIAEVTGKSETIISRTMRLLDLSDKLKDEIRRRNLTVEHGGELLRLPNQELQEKAADQVIKGGFNVKQTRDFVSKLLKVAKPKKAGRPSSDPLSKVWPELMADSSISACNYWKVEIQEG